MSATSKWIYTKTQACIPKKRPAVDSTFHLLSYGVLGFSWKLISMENGWKECSTLKNSQHLNPKNRSNFLLKHFQANRAKFGTHQKFEKKIFFWKIRWWWIFHMLDIRKMLDILTISENVSIGTILERFRNDFGKC